MNKVQAFKKEATLVRAINDPQTTLQKATEYIDQAVDLLDTLKKAPVSEKHKRELKAIRDALDKAAYRTTSLAQFLI